MTRTPSFETLTRVCCALALSSVFVPAARAETWVTVNPDGSVTRTEITMPSRSGAQTAPGATTTNKPLTTTLPPAADITLPSLVQSPGANAARDTRTQSEARLQAARSRTGGAAVRSGQRDSHGVYQGYVYPHGQVPQYYGQTHVPGPAYSGPIAPPPGQLRSPWITSIPLGTTYTYPVYPGYHQPPVCAPAVPACPTGVISPYPTYGYPAYPVYPGYPAYPAHPTYPYGGYGGGGYIGGGYNGVYRSSTTGAGLSIGRGGVRVNIGGSQRTTTTSTYGW